MQLFLDSLWADFADDVIENTPAFVLQLSCASTLAFIEGSVTLPDEGLSTWWSKEEIYPAFLAVTGIVEEVLDKNLRVAPVAKSSIKLSLNAFPESTLMRWVAFYFIVECFDGRRRLWCLSV